MVKQRSLARWRAMSEDDKDIYVRQAKAFAVSVSDQRKMLLDTHENRPTLGDNKLQGSAVAVGGHHVCQDDGKPIDSTLGPAGTCLSSGAFLGDWQVTRFLGDGTYGQVFEVSDCFLGLSLAVKVAVREDTLQDLDAERRILEKLVHPNILRSFGFVTTPSHAGLLLELACSDLASWLSLPANRLKASQTESLLGRWHMLSQLVYAVDYMHKKKVLHLDIKTNNFLVFSNLSMNPSKPQSRTTWVKVADFGLSQVLVNDSIAVHGNAVFASNFRAPELLLAGSSTVRVSYPCDIYALGCCVYDIFRCEHAGPLLFPYTLSKHLVEVSSVRGQAAAFASLARYRDERLNGNRLVAIPRVKDAMAATIIKETVTPKSTRISLHAVQARIRSQRSD